MVGFIDSPSQAVTFIGQTYPSFLDKLIAAKADGPVLAAVLGDSAAIGLALGEADPTTRTGTVLSLMVAAEHRRRGHAFRLLSALENRFRELGVTRLTAVVPGARESTAFVDRLLDRLEWSPSLPRMRLYRTPAADFPYLLASPLFRRRDGAASIPIAAWDDTPMVLRDRIRDRVKAGGIDPFLSPFNDEPIRDGRLSLVAHDGDDPLGWMIMHRPVKNVVRYTALWVSPDRAGGGLSRRLLTEAVRRHAESDGSNFEAVATCGCFANNPINAFIERHFGGVLPGLVITTTFERTKSLKELQTFR